MRNKALAVRLSLVIISLTSFMSREVCGAPLQRGRVITNDDMLAAKEEASARSYPLPDHGTLKIEIPADWKEDLSQAQAKQPPLTYVFSQKAGEPFQISVSVGWPQAADQAPLSDGEIHNRVAKALDSIRSRTVEQTITIQDVKGKGGSGYYYFVTDRAPGPDEFKYLTQGIYQVENLIIPFTILTNDGQDDIAKAGLAAVASIAHSSQ